jgi:uncharacterized membrane protein YesL
MNVSRPSTPEPRPKLTLLAALTVAGDLIVISLVLLVCWLGVVTAAPGAVGALQARAQVNGAAPSSPLRTIWQAVKANFRSLWFIGPIAAVFGLFTWVSLAFWITVPAPLSVAMLAVVISIAAIVALALMAIPAASGPEQSFRQNLRRTVVVVASRPWPSVLALLAMAAVIVIAVRFPPIGILLIGGGYVESAYRAWSLRPAAEQQS